MVLPNEYVKFNNLLNKTITFTTTFNWPKSTYICNLIMYMNVHPKIFLDTLKVRLKENRNPFILLQLLVLFDFVVKKCLSVQQELVKNDILHVLIDLEKTTEYVNIRRRILRLFQAWPQLHFEDKINYINEKFKEVGLEYAHSKENYTTKEINGFCRLCEGRTTEFVICARCILLFCKECASKSLYLPQFGFNEQVTVCYLCYMSQTLESMVVVQKEIEKSLLKSIECPVCLDVMKKPIISCKSGHSICGNCKTGPCPVCREAMTTARNFAMEQLIENQKINCKFSNKGCGSIMTLDKKANHEIECKSREFQCEISKFCKSSCSWSGSFGEIAKHFEDCYKKKTLTMFSKALTFSATIYQKNDIYKIHLINFRNEKLFWCKFKKDVDNQVVYWTIQMIGSKEEAKNYYYEFEICCKPFRHFKMREICYSDTVDVKEIFNGKKCVSIPINVLSSFLNNNNQISIKYLIHNVNEFSI